MGSRACWLCFFLPRTPWAVGLSGTELPSLNGKRSATRAGFQGSEAHERPARSAEPVVEQAVRRAWAGPQLQGRAQGAAATLPWGLVAPQE